MIAPLREAIQMSAQVGSADVLEAQVFGKIAEMSNTKKPAGE
jgi:hypothetical protein